MSLYSILHIFHYKKIAFKIKQAQNPGTARFDGIDGIDDGTYETEWTDEM